MIPAAFDYVRAGSAEEAISLIGEHGDEAKFLAGGHSLLPLMKLRLAQPSVLDRHRPPQRPVLHPRRRRPHRHRRPDPPHDVETLRPARRARPAAGPRRRATSATRRSATAARSAARSPTPTRRPTCPATTLALGATYVAQGPNGTREIAAADFYEASSTNALAADELLTEIRVPKMQRRRLELPEVQPAGPGLGDRRRRRLAPQRRRRRRRSSTWARRRSWPPASPSALAGGASVEDAAEQAVAEAEPQADLNASVEYRTHLAKVLTRRALEAASS